jgi:ferrous-iron efflux pump FieF
VSDKPAEATAPRRGPPVQKEHHAQMMRRATYASVGVATILIVTKFIVWRMSGSVALLASLLDSTLDVFASMINLFAVRHALLPADREHRFGHGKAEALAALGQSLFVGGAAVLLVWEAAQRILDPTPIEAAEWAVAVMMLSLVLTIVLVRYQRKVARETGSVAIAADSLHYITDVMVNAGIVVGLLAVALLNWRLLDPFIAISVAAYLVYAAWQIAQSSLDMLMDRELDDDKRHHIREIALLHPEVRAIHDLRTRSSGVNSFIQFHLELDGDIPLTRAHQIADEVEDLIAKEFKGAEILIHQDPVGLKEERPHFA